VEIWGVLLLRIAGIDDLRDKLLNNRLSVYLSAFMLLILSIAALGVEAADSFEIVSVETHHVVELNSQQPYVAGFHVDAEDLRIRETVDATAVTVSFPSAYPSFFPSGGWLGGGMFVQAQDTAYRNVDYGFYMMLVVDYLGNLYVDLGLHQTRENTAPLQMPTSELVYAYTWRVSGVDYAMPVKLLQRWSSDGFVHYSLSVSGNNVSLISVDVASKLNCENIIRKFYAGNSVVKPFPFSRYVDYFQFGVVSSERISDNHWSVSLKEPEMLRSSRWVVVERAWSVQGNMAYLDFDWKWGGAPYEGVDAQHNRNHEILFSYNGRTLLPGRVLWDDASPSLKSDIRLPTAYSALVSLFDIAMTMSALLVLVLLVFCGSFLASFVKGFI
jgi:hypothetical protein